MQFLRASERDEQGGACCLSVFRSGMGAFLVLQPGGRGACLSFRPGGVFGSLSAERGGVVVCGVLPQGGIVRASSSSLCLGGPDPPLVQHRPRVTYSGTAKGPLLGGLPIVSGLEGVCVRRRKRRREGLNPAACCENAWSGVKAIGNKSEAWG